ncbi:50S ribosomal protein L2 [Candidatus Woesearchaeota archaeon]|nr:50S ribosomal protein L2 [Candidatus Woesearchaeota archaeon]
MGKNIKSQRRGRATTTYTRPSFNFTADTRIGTDGSAVITELVHCRAHSAPLAKIRHEDGSVTFIIAPEGIKSGQEISIGGNTVSNGNVLRLGDIPEGTNVFSIENVPGDGGKFVKASGLTAKIVAKSQSKVTILLPSKKNKDFNPNCKAIIGVAAGGGRPEKPFYKAGRKYHRMRAKNMYWPEVCGSSMNAVDHPFGGRSSHHKGRPTIAPHNAPPGKKVGSIRPRRTGKKR